MARPRIETPGLHAIAEPNFAEMGEILFPRGFTVTPFDSLVATVSKAHPGLPDSELVAQIVFIGTIPEEFTVSDLQNYRAFLRGDQPNPLCRSVFNVRAISSHEVFVSSMTYKNDLQFVVATLLTLEYDLAKIRQILGEESHRYNGVNTIIDLMILDLYEKYFDEFQKLASTFGVTISLELGSVLPLLQTHKSPKELSLAVAELWLNKFQHSSTAVNLDRKQPRYPNNNNSFNYINRALRAYARYDESVDDPRTRANKEFIELSDDLGTTIVNVVMGWSIGGHQITDMIDRGYDEIKKHSGFQEDNITPGDEPFP